MIFDENFRFDKHINNQISKAFLKLKQAYRYKNFLSVESKKILVESYILAQFNYCDSILTNISQQLKNKIQRFQNSCVRFIFDLKKYDHITTYFKTLNTLNMDNRRKLHALTLMHKIVNRRAPGYLSNKIKYNHNVHTHNTRGKNNLCVSKSNNNYGFNTFFNKIGYEYNMIISELKNSNRISDLTFKIKCKDHLLKKQA